MSLGKKIQEVSLVPFYFNCTFGSLRNIVNIALSNSQPTNLFIASKFNNF